jgi:hypothetical protein
VSVGRVCSLGASITVSGGSLCTLDFHAPRKMSTEVPNLSKEEMHFNFSLSFSIWVSITRGRIRGHHMSSNPSRAPIYFRLRRPIRAAGFGGTTGSLCLAMNVIMFIELYFDFMSVFMYFYPHVVSRFLSVPLLV